MKIYKVEEENISEYNQKIFFKLVPISSSTVGCFGKRSTGALGDGLDLLTKAFETRCTLRKCFDTSPTLQTLWKDGAQS